MGQTLWYLSERRQESKDLKQQVEALLLSPCPTSDHTLPTVHPGGLAGGRRCDGCRCKEQIGMQLLQGGQRSEQIATLLWPFTPISNFQAVFVWFCFLFFIAAEYRWRSWGSEELVSNGHIANKGWSEIWTYDCTAPACNYLMNEWQ